MGQQPTPIPLGSPENYINREVSLLAFHRRVLEQAKDPGTPLLERLRFLTISTTNLDEFFEVRVAKLKQQIQLGLPKPGPDGLSPQETLQVVSREAQELVTEQYRVTNEILLPALEQEGVVVLRRGRWTEEQRRWIQTYFRDNVLPVLTPMGLDPSHPFPQVLNKSLNFIVSLEGKDAFHRDTGTAVVQVPRVLPRLIALPPELADVAHPYVLLSSVVHAHVSKLFPGMKITGCFQFRVTRNSELWVDEEEVDDLLHALKGELPRRKYGAAVRLEMPTDSDAEVQEFLLDQFHLVPGDLYLCDGPVNLHRLEALYEKLDRPDLKYPPFLPGLPSGPAQKTAGANIFEQIRRHDILLHHPYQGFAPVMELLRQAAVDPDVLAIKQTVYRTGSSSQVADALLEAARAGKEVTAVVELRARFDEAANIDIATRLQQAGAKVVYGIVGYKTHAKMLLIVRREADGVLRRYVHLGTGNYHPGTARAYTDISTLTCDEEITLDVHKVFQQLTGLGRARRLKRLLQAPFTLQKRLLELIGEEAKAARRGKPARIVAKMNSLNEPQIIRALYEASRAGVQIDLLVRGLCCLRPGVPGLSDTIRVRSVVGRFLEHSRIFSFHADGQDVLLCASADWMGRNFFRRIEVAFPVDDPGLKKRLRKELDIYLEDNAQAWDMQPDGTYRRAEATGEPRRAAQEILLQRLSGQEAAG